MKIYYPAYLTLLFIGSILFSACGESGRQASQYSLQTEIESSPIEITWEVVSNLEPENQFSATLTFKNNGEDALPDSGWALYFNSIRPPVNGSFGPELSVSHINGDFFKLEPTEEFEAIEPGESRSYPYHSMFFAIKETDAPDGFYFQFDDRIEEVSKVTVLPFTEEEQVKRSENDILEIPDAESRYRTNEDLTMLPVDEIGKLTPTPVSLEEGEGVFSFDGSTPVYYAAGLEEEAEWLHEMLEQYGIETNLIESENRENQAGIILSVETGQSSVPESYLLEVDTDDITITGVDRSGLFYGIQSLRALIANRQSDDLTIPSVSIEDAPAFSYRGMHLDVSRNFQSKESVLRLLDAMALYKLNHFQFHLTDDEGWRLAIDPLPELTEVGGRRGHTLDDSEFLIPSYGSGPSPVPGESFGSGWYSRDDYIEILRFANRRHIEVIPEIDIPGHARAAIKAMEHRYRQLAEAGDLEAAEEFRLHDPADTSEYRSIQNFNDNVINVCRESTYRFLETVFDEIIAMHREADAPLSSIHVGGDEVPNGVWEGSPACEEYMNEQGLEEIRDLWTHFFDRMRSILAERGLTLSGWEEVGFQRSEDHGVKEPNPELAGSVIPYVWNSIWGTGLEDSAYRLANAGFQVVMSNASNLYFDMAVNKNWQEPGFYWADMFDSKETYSFIPYNLFKNGYENSYGHPVPEEHYEELVALTPEGRENILGIQGQLWTETVNEPGRMEYMIFPRFLSLAERAWAGNPEWAGIQSDSDMWEARDTAWNEFANRVGRLELPRLDRYYEDFNYRIPVPGAVVEDGYLKVNSSFPGFTIRYSLTGETPTEDSDLYEGPVMIEGSELIQVAAFNQEGRSGRAAIVRIGQ